MPASPVRRSNTAASTAASRGRSMSPVRNRTGSGSFAQTTAQADPAQVLEHVLNTLRSRTKCRPSIPTTRTVRSWALTCAIVAILLMFLLRQINGGVVVEEEEKMSQNTDDRAGNKDSTSTLASKLKHSAVNIATMETLNILQERINNLEQRLSRTVTVTEKQQDEEVKRRVSLTTTVDKEVKALHQQLEMVSKRVLNIEQSIARAQTRMEECVSRAELKQEHEHQLKSLSDTMERRIGQITSGSSSHHQTTQKSNELQKADIDIMVKDHLSQKMVEWKNQFGKWQDDLVLEMNEKLSQAIAEQRRLKDEVAFDDSRIRLTVNQSLELFREDGGVGRADFALVAGGASVIRALTSSTYWGTAEDTSLISRLLFKAAAMQRPPEEAISPSVELGSCWPCRFGDCRLAVRLSARVRVTAVSLEHIAQSLSIRPSSEGDTAPKDFVVYALSDDQHQRRNELGRFKYVRGHPLIQTFPVQKTGVIARSVLLEVTSNYGHDEAVCIYRFRVHGEFVS